MKSRPISAKLNNTTIEFPSVAAAAKHFNINMGTLKTRLRDGWSTEEALGLVPRTKTSFMISVTHNGETSCFKSVRAAARKYGMSHDLVHSRLRYGWTIEEALNITARTCACEMCGKTFESNRSDIKCCSDECYKRYAVNYMLSARRNDLKAKLTHKLRNRLRQAVARCSKHGSAVSDLGCSIECLKKHLESQFYDERMSWETWGTEWQIDHIYPLSQADLEDRVQFLAVNNWRNLQPLTIADNSDKSDKVLPEAQLLFDELCDMFERKEEAA